MELFVILMVTIAQIPHLKKSRIKLVNKLYDEGHTIIIDTRRGSVSGKIIFLYYKSIKILGGEFHTVRTGTKIGADFFIDDTGIQDKWFFQD